MILTPFFHLLNKILTLPQSFHDLAPLFYEVVRYIFKVRTDKSLRKLSWFLLFEMKQSTRWRHAKQNTFSEGKLMC